MLAHETHGTTAVVRLARGKGNALNIDFLEAIDAAFGQLAGGPARAVVLTGQGKTFGAGVDLPELLAGGPAYVRRFLPCLVQVFERLARFPKPLVAAVNGHAIAGGAIIMLACDQRILARGSAQIGLSEVRVGVRFPAWALEIARFATPPEHFPTLIGAGRTYAPDEALTRGLVDELAEPEQLLARALAVAEELGGLLPSAFQAAKQAVRRPLFEAVARAQGDDAAVIEHWCSAEVQAEIARFAAQHIGGRG